MRQLIDTNTRNNAAHPPRDVMMANAARMDRRAIAKNTNRFGFTEILTAIYNRLDASTV
jgi:hypothetical protein